MAANTPNIVSVKVSKKPLPWRTYTKEAYSYKAEVAP
jgi:hypothetical protein